MPSPARHSLLAVVLLASLPLASLALVACSSNVVHTPGIAEEPDASEGDDAGSVTSAVDGGAASGKDAGKTSGGKDSGTPVEAESCASSGFCTVPASHSFGVGGFLHAQRTPDDTLWLASYGAYRRGLSDSDWTHYDLTWPDQIDTFRFQSDLYSLAAFSRSDAWVGGAQGYVAHFNGGSFVESPHVGSDVWALGGASSNDMWLFTSNGQRFRYTGGAAWVNDGSAGLRASGMQVRASNDIWVYGAVYKQGTEKTDPAGAYHYNGTTWTRTLIPTTQLGVSSLYMAADGTGYAVASSGSLSGSELLHYSAGTWSKVTGLPGSGYLTGVSGTSASDVWVASSSGMLLHHDGVSWTSVSVGTSEQLLTVQATSPTDVLVGGTQHIFRKK
jgi:hypothetical protein